MGFRVFSLAVLAALLSARVTAKTAYEASLRTQGASLAPAFPFRTGPAERETEEEAIELARQAEAQLPGDNQLYRDVFFELFRLGQLPNSGKLALESLGAPWPSNYSDLVSQLKKELAGDKPRARNAQLGELLSLLKVENALQRDPKEGYERLRELRAKAAKLMAMKAAALDPGPVGAALRTSLDKDLGRIAIDLRNEQDRLVEKRRRLLREHAHGDLQAMIRLHKSFADYPMHLPRSVRASLEGKMKIEESKANPGLISVRAGDVAKLLGDEKAAAAIPLPDMLTLAANARALSRGVRGDSARQDDLAALFDDAKHKRQAEGRAVPERNVFAGPFGIPGQFPSGSGLKEFYAPSSPPPGTPGGKPNACYAGGDGKNLVTPRAEGPRQQAELAAALEAQAQGQTAFRIQSHTARLDAQHKVESCMSGVSENVQRSPDDPDKVRFVIFTAGHCLSPDVNGIDILGVAKVPGSDLRVFDMGQMQPEAGETDVKAVAVDLPPETARRLLAQKDRFVSLPPETFGRKEMINRFVTTDINFPRPVSDKTTIVGKTFAIPGDENGNFVGVNHLLPENEGQGIDPGTSGSPNVLNSLGKRIYLGPTSYKCLAGEFQGGVGAIVSGNKVFDFLRSIAGGRNSLAFQSGKRPASFAGELVAHAPGAHSSPASVSSTAHD